jgi:hypothetical protein
MTENREEKGLARALSARRKADTVKSRTSRETAFTIRWYRGVRSTVQRDIGEQRSACSAHRRTHRCEQRCRHGEASTRTRTRTGTCEAEAEAEAQDEDDRARKIVAHECRRARSPSLPRTSAIPAIFQAARARPTATYGRMPWSCRLDLGVFLYSPRASTDHSTRASVGWTRAVGRVRDDRSSSHRPRERARAGGRRP